MRPLHVTLLILILLSIATYSGRVSATDGQTPDDHIASPARMDLIVPDEIWAQILDNTGHSGSVLGYSADEMVHFAGSDHILRTIEMLFRDITDVPRFSGLISNNLLRDPQNFAYSTFLSYRLLDAYSARVMSYEPLTSWEADWIPEDAAIDEAFEAILVRGRENGIINPITDEARSDWDTIPPEIKRLIVRVIIASIEATPWLHEAFDEEFLKGYFEVENLDDVPRDQFYELATWPWHPDTPELAPRESFDALDRFDMKYFATGSNEFMRIVYGAIDEYLLAVEETENGDRDLSGFEPCIFDTVAGRVRIFGPGYDVIEGDYSIVIDLGGHDNYTGSTAVPRSYSNPIGVVIDLGGNDTYDSGDERGALACGSHGIGAIFDLGGDDVYRCDESGIGCAWFGTGLVVDYGGDDQYYSRIWGQASGYAGVGMLIDLDGDDYYSCIEHSQGHAMTLGFGAIIDPSGDDIYYADPRGNISELYEGRTCNFAQGAAYGRRADFGDGHSLGGGIGMLIDGDGDDSYTGSCYVQGASYWWALGIIEDRSGDDTYACEQYSIGSAPHFAIGCCVDLEGNDKYNVGNETIERQFQAHARDGSFGVFIDGSGDDEYFLTNLCAGSSDLNCLTLFWDRTGDDIYIVRRIPPRTEASSFGHTTTYDRFNTFRDEMLTVGVFLDTGGNDLYEEILPEDEEVASGLVRLQIGDSTEWRHREGPLFWGYGLDVDYYSPDLRDE